MIIATCVADGDTVEQDIVIKGSTPNTTPTDPPQPTTTVRGSLPSTGSDTDRPVVMGGALVGTGLVFLLVSRLRRRPSGASTH